MISAVRKHQRHWRTCSSSDGRECFPPDKPGHPDEGVREFTVATWNVRNLYMRRDEKKPEAELQAVAETLKSLNADVVALQEVDNIEALDTFQQRYMKGDAYPYRVLVEGNDGRGIDVALLSRFPIKTYCSYRKRSFPVEGHKTMAQFKRDVLETLIEVTPGFQARFYTVHFKSRRGGKRADQVRYAEAGEARKIMEERRREDPATPFLIAGDFNDTPGTRTLKSVGEGDPPLTDPTALEGNGNQPTHHDRKYGDSRFDYLLTSPELTAQYKKGSARVVHTEATATASDHDPVVATFYVSRKGTGTQWRNCH